MIKNTGSGDIIKIETESAGGGDHLIYLADMALLGPGSYLGNGISIANISGAVLERLWVASNGGSGISLFRAFGSRIINCVIAHNRKNGIRIQEQGNSIHIVGNKINGNGLDGAGYANLWLSGSPNFENLGVHNGRVVFDTS